MCSSDLASVKSAEFSLSLPALFDEVIDIESLSLVDANVRLDIDEAGEGSWPTFETDDEQFVPGSFENINDRLAEEMDVMRFLIDNVWYWRARLDVQSITVSDDDVTLDVVNHGLASTANASLEYHSPTGEVLWASPYFTANASNLTSV